MRDSFITALEKAYLRGSISQKYQEIASHFYQGYVATLKERFSEKEEGLFLSYLELVCKQHQNPYTFSPYHEALRAPFDYYQFGIDILLPLVDRNACSVSGKEIFQEVTSLLKKKENVIFFANHQTEADPIAISILLQEIDPKLGAEMIFVAGERVVTDPFAVPFSLGRHLLCIYSKRYIDHPPEDKRKKQLHNQHTMQKMKQLLSQGGKAIYVAPSGGRDRPGKEGHFELAPFDPQSIEMFYLMGKKSSVPTHFYPLTLKTHSLMPPPESVQRELGEVRTAQEATLHLALSPEIDMEHIPNNDMREKHARREERARSIYATVNNAYMKLP